MTIKEAFKQITIIRKKTHSICIFISILRWLLMGLFISGLWIVINPGMFEEGFYLGLITIFICPFIDKIPSHIHLSYQDFLIGLDITFPQRIKSIYSIDKDEQGAVPHEWVQSIREVTYSNRQNERQKALSQLSSLVIPIALNMLTFIPAQDVMGTVLNNAIEVVTSFQKNATLTVLQGYPNEKSDQIFELSPSSIKEIDLVVPNLIKLDLVYRKSENPPVIALSKANADSESDYYQSFQMIPDYGDITNKGKLQQYNLSFSVDQDTHIRIPSIYGSNILATINVRKLPIPIVELKTIETIEEPWPDDQELNLEIKVKAKNPLQLIRLLIRVGKKVSKELVNSVSAPDLLNFETTYKLYLEPYIESDMAEVEIIAEAIDQAIPTPLIGQSPPQIIRTASAYGRYRQTLNTLYSLKSLVDQSLQKKDEKLSAEAIEVSDKAAIQAKNTPFFDGLDRVMIDNLNKMIEEQANLSSLSRIYEISSNLNSFLEEHEILDDRERDRDFFVAARSLSRLLEQDHDKRQIFTESVVERIIDFVDQRRKRWVLRVSYLRDSRDISSWPNIRDQHPFKKLLGKTLKADQKKGLEGKQKALTFLSQAVSQYRSWIEELEAAEDKARSQREEQRQKGLADARNELKKIQRLQNSISTALDRAATRDKKELESQWPATRMKANSNIDDTSRLERKMRLLAPEAATRLGAALQAMELTKENGNISNFNRAESFSDLASRLLRQAQKSSEGQKKRQRRRRRVAGDQYYGQAVHGGDVEINRDYEVDRRFREDILDEIQNSDYNESERVLLDNYLRRVIR